MAKYFYDRETDTVYFWRGDGSGWFALLLVLAVPFFIIASWLKQYATFVDAHLWLSAGIFLGLSVLMGSLAYRKRKAAHKRIGVLAVVVSVLPVGIAQGWHAIPYVIASGDALGITFEWVVVTALTVGLSCFINQICFLLKNGWKHLWIAAVYLVITSVVVFG